MASQLPSLEENKEIAGLLLSKLKTLGLPTKLRVVHNSGPLDDHIENISTIYIVKKYHGYNFSNEIVIEFDVDAQFLQEELKYKFDFLDSLEYYSETEKKTIDLPLRYKHKTLVLCQGWEQKYFVDHSQGTDFLLAWTNKVIVENYNPEQVLLNEFKEIIAMRRPELLKPFLGLNVQLSVFQTEQMSVDSLRKEFLRTVLSKIKIYDYSQYNIDQYKHLPNVTELRPVETPEKNHLKKLYEKSLKKYDFAFSGQMTPRRKNIINNIKAKGFTINCIENRWGHDRDIQIVKCKSLLNLHQSDEHKIFESSRCNRYIDVMPIYSEESYELNSNCILLEKIYKKHVIYVLCHNKEIYDDAIIRYKQFYWARPILMIYQDDSYENAFWKQLIEIKLEWINAEMVGTISASAYKKIDLKDIELKLKSNNNNFIHFHITNNLFFKEHHPHITEITKSIINELKLNVPKFIWACNYWASTPQKMISFVEWFNSSLYPTALKHPLIFKNANYKNKYYSHLPFVLERLNICYFYNQFE